MKYVIEIEDKPLCYYDKESNIYFPRVRKAIGFKTLVFDEDGLEKLTPLDKALEEAYQKGYDEAKLIYQNPHAESDYQKGLEYAWDAVRKIAAMPTEVSNPLFGYFGLQNILSNVAPAEAIAKLKAYEEKKKANKITEGDVVEYTYNGGTSRFVVLVIKGSFCGGLSLDADRGVANGWNYSRIADVRQTGEHYDISDLLNALKGGEE